MTRFLPRAAIALTLLLPALAQAQDTPATDCVDLAAGHEIVRGGTQSFLLKDGERHYRVKLRGACDKLPLASRLRITTAGQDNRLCPAGSRVETNRGTCDIAGSENISAEEFTRQKARLRR
ncbi:hypothetical protein [Pseudoxanthomonas beigongshangi]